jgi:RNA polymerase sigma factor (TIGR02999 family)
MPAGSGEVETLTTTDQGDVTRLLRAFTKGDGAALDHLFPIVYDELRSIAHRRLMHERRGHTLNTTALVHEAYLKLVDLDQIRYQGRAHFFAVAAHAMRNILVSYAHRRNRKKRGGGRMPIPLDEVDVMTPAYASDLLSLNDALKQLEAVNERHGRVVECRFFGGMSVEETAEALDISPATVKRDWTMARAWLLRELKDESYEG